MLAHRKDTKFRVIFMHRTGGASVPLKNVNQRLEETFR